MKKATTTFCLTLALLCLGMPFLSHAAPIIDVVDGYLLAQGYRIALDNKQTTISLQMEGDEDILCVETKDMTTVLRLDTIDITVSERASPFVNDLRHIDPAAPPQHTGPPRPRVCRDCGETDLSNHHCPRCDMAYCVHDDFQCSYRLNPVPTENPLLKKEKGDADTMDDSTWYSGYDMLQGQAVKPQEWAPGLAFQKIHATASPDPDDIFAPPAK